jgi:hypothetical protein
LRGAGLLCGKVPIVKQNVSLVTIDIVIVSLLAIEIVMRRRRPQLECGLEAARTDEPAVELFKRVARGLYSSGCAGLERRESLNFQDKDK